jgi:ribosomal protein S18 acetylase RimI-like enzyme
MSTMTALHVRRASPVDAAAIVRVLEAVASVAVHETQGIVGFQSLELWSSLLPSMAHVGQVETFLLPEWRARGVGHKLWGSTQSFARQGDYRKIAIQVRATNAAAQSFYSGLRFKECGRLTRQV